MRPLLQTIPTIALILICTIVEAQTPQVIFVNKAATGSATGSSWANAYPELRTAIAAAASLSGPKEIWVAQAEYKPTDDLNRGTSFVIPSQTFLFGGFIGSESTKEQRNWKSNRTVLSGDLGRQFDKSDNSYHVVLAKDIDQNSGIDGFTIKEGNANGTSTALLGGGILIWSTGTLTKPQVNNCIFYNNSAGSGGALSIQTDGSFSAQGQITNCKFDGNNATTGGAVFVSSGASLGTFINCAFSSNQAQNGGAIANSGTLNLLNSTVTFNNATVGPAIYSSTNINVRNSIVWKNFSNNISSPVYGNQINDSGAPSSTITNNIIQGGYGVEAAGNLDVDPLFESEPTFVGKYPRTSIIPVSSTNPKYENRLEFNGPVMGGPWPYHAYKDHTYNRIYMPGRNLQVLDFSSLVNNKPTSTVYESHLFPRTQHLEKSIHTAGNRIYFASFVSGMFSVHRQTGLLTPINVFAGEPVTPQAGQRQGPKDLLVDDANNLLYCPVFYDPGSIFYGLLELNLTTQAKRWITTTSTPVSISPVLNVTSDQYWGIHRILLDEQESVLYLSTGNGVWWWNRNTNQTGTISSNSGIALAPGSPALPSNITTGMFMDHAENKMYIGTHAGLFVWNRTDNTTRVYNTENSKLMHNLINTITKNEELHLIYVACEEGGVFVINTSTGEEKLIHKDQGSDVHPQFMDDASGSAYYDAIDKKLYATADHWTGGVWIQDYNNLLPDFGDLNLRTGSPAIDRGNATFLPSEINIDINGLERRVNFATLFGENSLDIGAYEKIFQEEEAPGPVIPENLAINYVLSYNTAIEGIKDANSVDNYPVRDVNRTIQYIDGLGRPAQSVVIQGSPSKSDVVQPVVYDEFGRESVKYLPFTSGNDGLYKENPVGANSPQQNFYSGTGSVANDSAPFATTQFESSPLNRPLKAYGPGQVWSVSGQNKPIELSYLSNAHALVGTSTNEAIFAFKVNSIGSLELEGPLVDFIEPGGYYSSGKLSIKVTRDENGHSVREYTNLKGQVILKKVQAAEAAGNLNDLAAWASTYYIYDDLGNLRFVLQPEGFKNLQPLLNQN